LFIFEEILGIININIYFFFKHNLASKRTRKESIKLKSCHVSVTTGAEGNDICNKGVDMNKTENNKQYWCSHAYYAVLDAIIGNFELRFSKESLELANSIDNLIKLNMNKSMMFIDHCQLINTYKWNVIIV